ncbi:MAG: hypothetical protein J6O60_02485 [Lachnospiraceae bacterium]|nr:hypothetical protein [Lachnospiraceae bacterium]
MENGLNAVTLVDINKRACVFWYICPIYGIIFDIYNKYIICERYHTNEDDSLEVS